MPHHLSTHGLTWSWQSIYDPYYTSCLSTLDPLLTPTKSLPLKLSSEVSIWRKFSLIKCFWIPITYNRMATALFVWKKLAKRTEKRVPSSFNCVCNAPTLSAQNAFTPGFANTTPARFVGERSFLDSYEISTVRGLTANLKADLKATLTAILTMISTKNSAVMRKRTVMKNGITLSPTLRLAI